MSVESRFQQRQQQFHEAGQAAQRRYNQWALGRLVWFAAVLVAVWLLIRFDYPFAAEGMLAVGAVGFLMLLRKHHAIRRERDLNRHLAFINQDEAARLNRQYVRSETGASFADPTHPYAGDLDVFGPHSLFRLLNRTHTYAGEQTLANWLKAPADPTSVRQRQLAASDLQNQLDWRQQLEALAYAEPTTNQSPAELLVWATAPAVPLPAYVNFGRFLLPVITAGVCIAWLTGYAPGLAVLLALGVHGVALSRTAGRAAEVSEQTSAISTALRAFQHLFRHAESVPGEAARLQSIRQAFTINGHSASGAIGQLARLTEGLNYRRNPYFFLLLGLPTLWDWHFLLRLDAWKQQHGNALSRWFDALGELESLNSLAGLAYAHPAYAVPELVVDQLTLAARSAAHPLLPPERSVVNSLSMTGSGQTILITGSNMSGKSTFLRTIGANVVLALAGAVVSAEGFTVSPVRVFTSMRTQDSLEESTSSFYAELKRLQILIRQSKSIDALPVLYFLDEILKGTNSADRHRGAEALIRQLHRTTASGFVSTHDLELGQLTNATDFVRNFHFQSDLRDGELVFDYTLRDGICQSFNASQLMQAIGIEMSAVAPQSVPADT